MNYTSYNVLHLQSILWHWHISMLMIHAAGFLKDLARLTQMCDSIKIRLVESLYCHKLTYLYPPVRKADGEDWNLRRMNEEPKSWHVQLCTQPFKVWPWCIPATPYEHKNDARFMLAVSRHRWILENGIWSTPREYSASSVYWAFLLPTCNLRENTVREL